MGCEQAWVPAGSLAVQGSEVGTLVFRYTSSQPPGVWQVHLQLTMKQSCPQSLAGTYMGTESQPLVQQSCACLENARLVLKEMEEAY